MEAAGGEAGRGGAGAGACCQWVRKPPGVRLYLSPDFHRFCSLLQVLLGLTHPLLLLRHPLPVLEPKSRLDIPSPVMFLQTPMGSHFRLPAP